MQKLSFHADGSFRICQLTDLHLITTERPKEFAQTLDLVRQIIRDTKPDLLQTGRIGSQHQGREWRAELYQSRGLLDTLHGVDDVMADGYHLLVSILELHVAQLDVG